MKQLIVFLFLGLIIHSPLIAADKKHIIQQLIELTHLADQAREISSFALNEITNRKEGLPDEEYKRLRDSIALSFNEQRLSKIMRDHLMHQYDNTLSPLWLETLQSAEFKKFAALEIQASKPENFPQLMDYAKHLQKNPAPKTRIALVNKLNQLTHASNLAIETQVAVAKVLLHAINPTLPSNKQMGTRQIQTALDALRMQTSQTLHNFTTVNYLFTYREVSDKELEHYVALYETPQGQWATSTLYDAVIKALQDAIQQFQNHALDTPNPPVHRVDITYTFLLAS